MEQRNADVELGPYLLPAHAGLGQNRLARIETETVLRVARPCARVQIEQNVIAPIVPRGQPVESRGHIAHIVVAQRVPIERVDGQHKEAGARRIGGVVATLGDGAQDFLVVEADGRRGGQIGRRVVVERIDVDEEFVVAARKVEAGLHATGSRGQGVQQWFFVVARRGEGVVVVVRGAMCGVWFAGRPNERG